MVPRSTASTLDWNLLYGFPGETARRLRGDRRGCWPPSATSIPPTACGPIRLDRFSPYHEDPAGHGMTSVRAMAPYRYLHPWPADVLDEVAYYFDFDYADGRGADDHVRAVRTMVDAWQASGPTGELIQTVSDPDRVVLVDTRGGAVTRHELLGWEAAAYLACDRPRPAEELLGLPELAGVAPREMAALVNRCVTDRTLLVHRRTCLAPGGATAGPRRRTPRCACRAASPSCRPRDRRRPRPPAPTTPGPRPPGRRRVAA